jgi:hypothetical protein
MQVGYCRLVTISTDNVIETNEFRTAVGGRVDTSLGPRPQSVDGFQHPGVPHEHDPTIPRNPAIGATRVSNKIYKGYWCSAG